MEWATLPPDRHASWALRLSDERGFARHVANFDPRTEVSLVGMLSGWKRAKPYVYSDAEIDALHVEQHSQRSLLTSATPACAILIGISRSVPS